MLSSAILFLVVLSQLNRFLYQPLYKHMEDRDASIQKDLKDAKNNVANIEDIHEEASRIIATAKKEASLIRENTYTKEKTLAEEKISQFKGELDEKYNIFIKDLNAQKKSLRNSLMENLPQFKERVSAKISSI